MKGEILKQLRKEKNLTQIELAKKLGVAKSTIGMVESNKQGGGRELTFKICNFFDVSIDFLEGRTENRSEISEEKKQLVSNFLEYLVANNIITDPNNIDEATTNMILKMVKDEVSNLMKKGDE